MINFIKSLFGKTLKGKKIFEGMDAPKPNFKIVATHVRVGKSPKNYMLTDGNKLKAIVEKWRFEPSHHPIGRCGYDYQIVFTNGDLNIPISVCFLCKTLIFNNSEKYKVSEKQIKALLAEDFTLI